jgi:hypothetical protein
MRWNLILANTGASVILMGGEPFSFSSSAYPITVSRMMKRSLILK